MAVSREAGFAVTDTSLRYLAILELIPRIPRTTTTKQLKAQLEELDFSTSTRGLQRDLERLADFVYPDELGYRLEGRTNHWYFEEDAPVKMFPSMDEHTALSLQVLERLASQFLPPQTEDALQPWFQMAKRVLAKTDGPAKNWREKIYVTAPGLPRFPPKFDTGIRAGIYQSVLDQSPLYIDYKKIGGRSQDKYLISPLGLIVRGSVTYLVAAKHPTADLRTFALHRISALDVAEDEDFHAPKGFNLKSYADSTVVLPQNDGREIEIELLMASPLAEVLAETPISRRQTVTQHGEGKSTVRATTVNSTELRRWLLSYGENVEVIKPSHLRADIADEISRMNKQYKRSPLANVDVK